MKSTTESFDSLKADHSTSQIPALSRTSRIHYILVAVLLMMAYLIASFISTTPDTISLNIGSGFLLFWLCGGLITLGLLTLSAKR